MSRRFAGAGLMRRPARDGAGLIDRTVEAIFGSILSEWWDARYGYTLDASSTVLTLTGQRRGVVLAPAAAINQPTWNPSDSNFNNHPSIVGDGINMGLGTNPGSGDMSPPLYTANGEAYAVLVGREVGDGSSAGLFMNITDASSVNTLRINEVNGQAIVRDAAPSNKNFNVNPDPESTTVHMTELWADSSVPQANASFDGTDETPQAIITGISGNAVRLGILSNIGGGGSASNTAFVQLAVCSSYPSAGQRAAYLAYAQRLWGVP